MIKFRLKSALFYLFRYRRLYSTNTDDILFKKVESCGVITLNKPKKLNSFNLSMARKLHPILIEWNRNPDISHILIEGTGEKAFCAGGDVTSVYESTKENSNEAEEFFRVEFKINHLISVLGKPYIALINGITMGGGAGLSVHGRYRVATEKTIFSMPETLLGYFPDVGSGYFMPRIPHPGLGLFLGLTGHRLKGLDNVWAGIATHFVESKNMEKLKDALVNLKFAETSKTTGTMTPIDQAVQTVLLEFGNLYTSAPAPEDLSSFLSHISTIFAMFANDNNRSVEMEHILAKLFNLYQDPTADLKTRVWAENCSRTLLRMSPTSLKVTLRLFQLGSTLSLADDLQMEFRLANHFRLFGDFHEGVRAILKDKTNNQRWSPNSIALVTPELVDSFFRPLEGVDEWSP